MSMKPMENTTNTYMVDISTLFLMQCSYSAFIMTLDYIGGIERLTALGVGVAISTSHASNVDYITDYIADNLETFDLNDIASETIISTIVAYSQVLNIYFISMLRSPHINSVLQYIHINDAVLYPEVSSVSPMLHANVNHTLYIRASPKWQTVNV